MSAPHWLIAVLDDHLPDLVGAERDRLAAVIVEAMPSRADVENRLANAIIAGNHTELRTARDIAISVAPAVCLLFGGNE